MQGQPPRDTQRVSLTPWRQMLEGTRKPEEEGTFLEGTTHGRLSWKLEVRGAYFVDEAPGTQARQNECRNRIHHAGPLY
ncbi:uncharacterized protein LOC143271983 isoform X10 [Peromyscus maniculatus bairdii]|uniref:uncharacterized protein LOC143271983 isoform X10 n=1 Tax=Peromyscus maniculatus bairdii TaxID=230844 RepID=UPI003FD006E8